MLHTKFDRLNQLNATISEINELKSQLMAELERLENIESETISEVSDIQSEILSTTQVVLTDSTRLADTTLKGCTVATLDNWETLERYVKYAGILIHQGIVYVSTEYKLLVASELPGGSTSPLQKAVDHLKGYHASRYCDDPRMPVGFYNLPELKVCLVSGKRDRNYWHANHIRKQVWYEVSSGRDTKFWKSENIQWDCDDLYYWLGFERKLKYPSEIKTLMITCPDRWNNYGGFSHEIGQFVTDKCNWLRQLNETIARTGCEALFN